MPPYSPSNDVEAHPDLDPQKATALLSKELMQLSFTDRNDISEEVHGVGCMAVEETPSSIQEGLLQLQREIDNLPSPERKAFDKAQTLPWTYVNDQEFRLRFLRSDLFDARQAAKRMNNYLNMCLDQFGVQALKRPLQSTDFKGKEEKSVLKGGLVQLLPYRDRAGRRILCILSDIMQYNHCMRVKIFLYLLTVASECEETQQKGVLFVMWPGSSTKIRMPGNDERDVCTKSFSSFPVRVAGFHFCWPDTTFFHFVRSFFVLVMGKNIRARVNFHCGERQELSYRLMGFGIPVQLMPTTEGGAIKLKNHQRWLKTRQIIEKEVLNTPNTQPTATLGGIECPRLNDVLYDRTKNTNLHPGNSRFRAIIEESKENHTKLNQVGKRDFAWAIVEEIEMLNGRFLSWDRDAGFWVPIEDREKIRTKVATTLRDCNKHTKAMAKCVSTPSVCKVSFDDGQELKKRRIVVSDDESSQAGSYCSSGGSSSGSSVVPSGCLSIFDFGGAEGGANGVFVTAAPDETMSHPAASQDESHNPNKRSVSPIPIEF